MNRDEYVSTLCRIGNHAGCQERPVVKCDCDCHNRAGVDSAPEGPLTGRQRVYPALRPAAPVG